MGRHKAAKNVAFPYWMSGRSDCREGRFLQVGNSLMLSEAVQALTPGARWLYFAMAMESGGKPEMTFTHSVAKKYGIASSSFERQIKELCDHGFIERIPDPDMMQFAPGRYHFTVAWKV